MFDEQHEDSPYQDELEDQFRELMRNSEPARRGYEAARSYGLDEECRLKAALIQLDGLNQRAMRIISNAIMHGMPVTEEVASVRNEILGCKADAMLEARKAESK